MYQLIKSLDNYFNFAEASAHCDIPCKIYDPAIAQIAVLSMVRMVELIEELKAKDKLSLADQAQLTRLVMEKEQQGINAKKEVTIIWGDYFKAPQIEKHPHVHELVHSIMMKASFAKQHVDKAATIELLDLVNQFAAIFWETKGVATYTATCPYPPQQTVVYPKLA